MVARKNEAGDEDTRGKRELPIVSSLRYRSFLRSYYFIAPTLCRLSKTGTYLWPKEMTGSEARMTSHYFTLAQKSLQGQKIVRGCHNLIPRVLLCMKFQWRMWLPLPEVMALRACVRYSAPCSYLRDLREDGVALFVAPLLYTLDVGRQLLLAWPSHLYLRPWRRKAVPSEILVTKNTYSRFW